MSRKEVAEPMLLSNAHQCIFGDDFVPTTLEEEFNEGLSMLDGFDRYFEFLAQQFHGRESCKEYVAMVRQNSGSVVDAAPDFLLKINNTLMDFAITSFYKFACMAPSVDGQKDKAYFLLHLYREINNFFDSQLANATDKNEFLDKWAERWIKYLEALSTAVLVANDPNASWVAKAAKLVGVKAAVTAVEVLTGISLEKEQYNAGQLAHKFKGLYEAYKERVVSTLAVDADVLSDVEVSAESDDDGDRFYDAISDDSLAVSIPSSESSDVHNDANQELEEEEIIRQIIEAVQDCVTDENFENGEEAALFYIKTTVEALNKLVQSDILTEHHQMILESDKEASRIEGYSFIFKGDLTVDAVMKGWRCHAFVSVTPETAAKGLRYIVTEFHGELVKLQKNRAVNTVESVDNKQAVGKSVKSASFLEKIAKALAGFFGALAEAYMRSAGDAIACRSSMSPALFRAAPSRAVVTEAPGSRVEPRS